MKKSRLNIAKTTFGYRAIDTWNGLDGCNVNNCNTA